MPSSVSGIILCRLCTKGDRRKYDGDMPMYNKYKRRKRRMYNRKYKRKLKKLSKYSISVHEVDEYQMVHWHRHTTCEFTEERFLHTVRSIQIEL